MNDTLFGEECAVVTSRCPNCGAVRSHVFHHVAAVPVNSCLMFTDRERAQSLKAGDIDLAFCPDCTFIFNAAWKPERTVYSDLYEETQGFSPTFKAFHHTALRREEESEVDRVVNSADLISCGSVLALRSRIAGWRRAAAH